MTKDIAIGIAVTVLITAISMYIPFIGFLFFLLIPLPVFYYRTALGRKKSFVIPLITFVIAAAFTGGISVDLFLFFELLMLGYSLGELFELNLSIEKTMLSATGVLILTALAGLLFYNFSSDAGVIAIASDYVEKNVGYSLSVYREIGIPEENIRMIENSIEEIKYVVVRILPSLFIASVLLVSWINLLMGRSLFLARKMRFPEFGPLNKWKSPDYLVWAVIAAGIMLLIPVKDIKIIGVNALLILLVIYFFQGIAIVAFFFEKKSAPKILRIFLYSLIGFQQILLLVIIIFGFFDVWVDIRRLATKEQNYNE